MHVDKGKEIEKGNIDLLVNCISFLDFLQDSIVESPSLPDHWHEDDIIVEKYEEVVIQIFFWDFGLR